MANENVQDYTVKEVLEGNETVLIIENNGTIKRAKIGGEGGVTYNGSDGKVKTDQLPSDLGGGSSYAIPQMKSAGSEGQTVYTGLYGVIGYAILAGEVLIAGTDFTQSNTTITLEDGSGIVEETAIYFFPSGTALLPRKKEAATNGQTEFTDVPGTAYYALLKGEVLLKDTDFTQEDFTVTLTNGSGIVGPEDDKPGTVITFFTY